MNTAEVRQAVTDDPAALPALTRDLGEFIASCTMSGIPSAAIAAAKMAIADCIGGAFAGLSTAPAILVNGVIGSEGVGPALVWGRARHVPARSAALANGTAAHAHAIDDTHESLRGHPSAPIVPAVFALGDQMGGTGLDRLTAYVVGIEVAGKLGRIVNDEHATVGWHTTGTLGCIGAAAACAHLLKLDAAQATHALGLAASLASGIRGNFATMTKAIMPGVAAEHGVLAANLAKAGFTAKTTALEGHEGFIALFCGSGRARWDQALPPGAPWEILAPGVVVKRYPNCSLMHALLDLVREAVANGLQPDQIRSVRCGISRRLDAMRTKSLAIDAFTARFSVEYAVAPPLLGGAVDIGDFSESAVSRRAVLAWMPRIEIRIGLDFPPENGDFAELAIETPTGWTTTRRAKPLGHPSQPFDVEGLQDKFMRCGILEIGQIRADAAWKCLMALDQHDAAGIGHALA